MLEPNGPPPTGDLRVRALRVEHRPGQLVVWSGLPAWPVLLVTAPIPSFMLFMAFDRGRWDADSLASLLFALVWTIGAWTLGGAWTLKLDRGAGKAALRRGPWTTRRQLGTIVGVRVCSMRQAQIERVRRTQVVMPYAPYADIGPGVVLVDKAGRWWRVTRSQDRAYARPTPRWEDAVLAARLVANYLGLPFLPPYERPPGGLVPPPL